MSDFKYPIKETCFEFIEGFVSLKDLYKKDPYAIHDRVKLKNGWYLTLTRDGHILLLNDKYPIVFGETEPYLNHPSTMGLILRDYLSLVFENIPASDNGDM